MPTVAQRRYSYAEYLALEAGSLHKHEYFEGNVVAMAGGTGSHSRLKTNLTVLVGAALADRPCEAYDSDLRVRVLASGLATYPDLTVICGPRQPHPEDPHAATNPSVIFEVLSKETAAYDRGEKFDHYQLVPELKHYVLVDHARRHVDVYSRQAGGSWGRRGYGPDDVVDLGELGLVLPVGAVYRGWEAERAIDEGKPPSA